MSSAGGRKKIAKHIRDLRARPVANGYTDKEAATAAYEAAKILLEERV